MIDVIILIDLKSPRGAHADDLQRGDAEERQSAEGRFHARRIDGAAAKRNREWSQT